MMISKKARMLVQASILAVLVAVVGAEPAAQQAGEIEAATKSNNGLIVHEWGTFTSIAGKDGVAVEWQPLSDVSDLPSFVYNASGLAAGKGLRSGRRCVKCAFEELVRMETPVIYFYADRETSVNVRVDFPQGKITEWYPHARLVYVDTARNSRNPSFIDWGRITVTPGVTRPLPAEAEPSHYYPARETDASQLRVCGVKGEQHEKFLFYRGVGSFELPLAARLEGGRVVVTNTSSESISQFIVFESREGKVGYQIRDSLDSGEATERPALNSTIESLERDLELMLIGQGLYAKEARAMIKTWRDSWFEDGLRVFYIVPRTTTDRVLPITIQPGPSELIRVLVGRTELITPEAKMEVRRSVSSLNGSSRSPRDIAADVARKHGRFAEPVLKSVLAETSEPKLRARIQKVINYSATL